MQMRWIIISRNTCENFISLSYRTLLTLWYYKSYKTFRVFIYFTNQIQTFPNRDVKMKQHILWHPSFHAGYYFHLSYRYYRRNHHHHRGMSPEMKEIGNRNMILMNCTATIKSHRIHSTCVRIYMWLHSSILTHKKSLVFAPFSISPCVANGRDASYFHLFVQRVLCFFLHLTIRHNYTCVKYS